MRDSIYLLQDSGQLVDMREQAFKSEDFLQNLIAEHPELLAGEQFLSTSPRRFLLISREMGLPSEQDGSDRWAIDHLFVDQDAILTVVEVKRSSDSRIRREVVGQMLDYASNAVVYLPIEKIRSRFERTYTSPEQQLQDFLGEEIDYDLFWDSVKMNLQAGKIRLLFVADDIPSELQRIVEFLNKHMPTIEVLAIEVKQYADSGENLRTLVPRIIGQTAEAQGNKKMSLGTRRQWDEESFFQEIERKGDAPFSVAKQILNWAHHNVKWGQGSQEGSFTPIFDYKGIKRSLFAVWTSGKIELLFPSYKNRIPFDNEGKRLELLKSLREIVGIDLEDVDISRSQPKFPLSILQTESNLQMFLNTFDWFIQETKSEENA